MRSSCQDASAVAEAAAAASALMLNRSPGKLEDGGGGWTSDGRTDQNADGRERFEEGRGSGKGS